MSDLKDLKDTIDNMEEFLTVDSGPEDTSTTPLSKLTNIFGSMGIETRVYQEKGGFLRLSGIPGVELEFNNNAGTFVRFVHLEVETN
jgi:hypothetical protein